MGFCRIGSRNFLHNSVTHCLLGNLRICLLELFCQRYLEKYEILGSKWVLFVSIHISYCHHCVYTSVTLLGIFWRQTPG